MQIIIYNFEICSTLYKRESNHVLKDIDEFSLALDSEGVAWAIFPYDTFELRCILLFIRFSYIMVKLLIERLLCQLFGLLFTTFHTFYTLIIHCQKYNIPFIVYS